MFPKQMTFLDRSTLLSVGYRVRRWLLQFFRRTRKLCAQNRIEVLVFGLALLLHLLMLLDGPNDPSWLAPVIDARTYHDLAGQFLSGRYAPITPYYQPPGFAYFLAGVYWICGHHLAAAHGALAVLGALTALSACRLAKRLFRPHTGLLAGCLTAAYGPLLFFNLQLLPAGLAALLNMVFLNLLLQAMKRDRPSGWITAGLCAGLAALTIPNNLFFLPLAAVGLFATRLKTKLAGMPEEQPHRRLRAVLLAAVAPALLAFGTLLALAPVTAQNALATGRFTLISHNGGLNFYIGNNLRSDATIAIRPGYDWESLDKMPLRAGIYHAVDADRFYYRQSLTYLRQHPRHFLRQLGRKLRQVTNSRELPRNVDVYAFTGYYRLLRILVWRIGSFAFPFGVVFPLACWGFVVGVRKHPGAWLPALFAAAYAFSVALFFVASRYRLVAIPALCVFAAVALDRGLWYHRRSKRQALVAAFVILVAAVWCNTPIKTATDGYNFHAELYTLLGLQQVTAGKFDAAAALLCKARTLDSDFAPTWRVTGLLYQRQGNLAAARDAYLNATRYDPRDAEAFQRLGAVLEALQQPEEAQSAYRRALVLSPETALISVSLAHLLYRQERRAEAATLLEQAIQTDLTAEGAYGLLAWIRATAPEDELRDGPRALSLIQFLIRWRGATDPMRIDTLAAALAETGRFAEAEQAGLEATTRWRDAGREDVAAQSEARLERYRQQLPTRE